MITKLNCRGYINYLYLQRNGSNAPADLLDKWSQLPEQELSAQLQNLYISWQLTAQQANNYESNFLAVINNAAQPTPQYVTPTPFVQPVKITQASMEQPLVSVNQKRGSFLYILTALVTAALVVGGVLWWKNSNQSSNVDNATSQEITTPVVPIPTTTEAIAAIPDSVVTQATPATTTTQTPVEQPFEGEGDENVSTTSTTNWSEADQANGSSIKALLAAEQEDNFENIYKYFSPNMEQYWDVAYPTREDLKQRYEGTFTKALDRQNQDIRIDKIEDNKYVATGLFSYYSVAKSKKVEVPLKTLFVFDNNGKIIFENKAQ